MVSSVIILAVETATSRQSVAVLEEEQVLGYHSQDVMGSHTRLLIPTIDRLFSSLNLRVTDLTGLAVSVGPGSFTGLRVGLATLSGFQVALGLPLVAVPTLEAMAWNFRKASCPLCPILKARTGEVYWAQFRWEDGKLMRLMEDQVGNLEEFARSVSEQTLVFGEGWLANRDRLTELLGQFQKEAPQNAMVTSAVSVGLASLERFRVGDLEKPGLVPRYVQRSCAEMSWDAQGGK